MQLIRQADVVRRSALNPEEFSYAPGYGAYIEVDGPGGKARTLMLSRQMVLF